MMRKPAMRKHLLLLCAALTLGACSTARSAPAPTPATVILSTPAAAAYTAAPEPTVAVPDALLAARVNGEAITKAQFEAALARQPGDPDAALNGLIQRALIAQEAARQGISVSEAQVSDEISEARRKAGGPEKYTAWLAASGLSEDDALEMARDELLTAALRAQALAALPREAEYVRIFDLVVETEDEARQAISKLESGAKFGPLAKSMSLDESTRMDDGDLGWCARGSGAIKWPAVEAAAFALQPGEISDVIASPIGFHVLKVIGRETRPLTDADAAGLQRAALDAWMAGLTQAASIEKLIQP